jgi:hypothetical protein
MAITRYKTRRNTKPIKVPFLNDSGVQLGTVHQEVIPYEEGIVLDVVVNEEHPEYDLNGYNVGAVKFRFLHSQIGLEMEGLSWALPLNTNITKLPLPNEVVLIFEALNRYYYISTVNVSNRVTSQALLFGIEQQSSEYRSQKKSTQNYTLVADDGAPEVDSEDEENRKSQFQDKEDIFRLSPQEGDVLFEGRSGHSLRFGSNFEKDQAPNLLIRVGPNPVAEKSVDSKFAVISEDINKDLSSIWMLSDQIVPLNFATVDDESHFKSMEEKPGVLDGNQIIINTDRMVVNTKQKELLVSTFFGTHFTTLQDHTVDSAKNYRSYAALDRSIRTGQKYIINVGNDYLLSVGGMAQSNSKKAFSITSDDRIFIGSIDNDSEPLVLGETLRNFMHDILRLFEQFSPNFTLPTIGIGPLNPGVASGLGQIRSRYGLDEKTAAQTKGWLSETNFVNRKSK